MILKKRLFSSTFKSHSPQDTLRLSSLLAEVLEGGEIVFLRGPIGAGKTTFVKGVAEAMGMPASPVSASFSLLKEYQSRTARIYHIDLFRLKESDLRNLGFESMLEDPKAIILAEWPDIISAFMPKDRLELDFELQKGDSRKIKATAAGPVSERLLNVLNESYK
ncbi:MAG: tRNA (adenosine(37)-N6)-threonylcarbamoyltransferase complex ATPase subunit type 1 TsaE [Elusimicrobiaceae bacterium]